MQFVTSHHWSSIWYKGFQCRRPTCMMIYGIMTHPHSEMCDYHVSCGSRRQCYSAVPMCHNHTSIYRETVWIHNHPTVKRRSGVQCCQKKNTQACRETCTHACGNGFRKLCYMQVCSNILQGFLPNIMALSTLSVVVACINISGQYNFTRLHIHTSTLPQLSFPQ